MAVSNTAELFYSLFSTFVSLAIVVGAVVLALMAYLTVKYRAKASTPEPEDAPRLGQIPIARGRVKTLAVSVSLSTIILGVLIFGTFSAIDTIQTPPQGTVRVNVIGYQFAWNFTYQNGREVAGILRVPVGENVVLNVTSRDVAHNFGIIDFKIKIDAIPGRTNTIWFTVTQPGQYRIQCFELCGLGHAFMRAVLIAMEPNDFRDWYSSPVGGN